ncbi:cardiolipin synthase [Paenibacillus sp. LHD-117]|uniref:cardiolipin synthase n=1 Tax=Paenibacillus sp. LHD-117 TaxID=3071412 RepID=UPI0027E0839E|nr:cardiolipin synthase [Paenibacillus sp. LHD-117]MDQ6421159.1 cardiolipin synthase [Paenibacillus sp. LHD-117]
MQVWLWCIVTALLAYVAQIGVILLLEHRRQSHLAAWIFVAMVCPYLGFAAYWLLGRRIVRVRTRRLIDEQASESDRRREAQSRKGNESGIESLGDRLTALVEARLPYPATNRNRTTVLTDGEDTFDSILKAIEQAEHHIHLDYYTIRNDGIGNRFLDELTKKAKAGVQVRVLYDGIGSLHLSESFIRQLRSSGAKTACFSPPGESLLKRRLNFRNHRKIVIVDGLVGFQGGINIGDEYLGLDKRLGYWRDTHLKLEGDSVHQLQSIFMDNWFRATKERIQEESEGRPSPYYPAHRCDNSEQVILVPGKPGIHDQMIVEALFVAMSEARQTIYATTPYFIPDPSIAASLRIAARSGIDVKLIIPGICDSKLVLLATFSYVQDMLDAGVQIYRYWKGFNHAKVLIVDGRLASVGTANLDMRSLYSNYELLAFLQGEKPVRRLTEDFMNDLAQSKRIDPEEFANRPRKQKAKESVLHLLSPLL